MKGVKKGCQNFTPIEKNFLRFRGETKINDEKREEKRTKGNYDTTVPGEKKPGKAAPDDDLRVRGGRGSTLLP